MKSSLPTLTVLMVAAFTAVSCQKEDPELVRQREDQRTEIKKLEGEIAVLDEKFKDVPEDRSKELADAKARQEVQTTELAKLEKDVATLEERKRDLEKTFVEYRRKYPVKSN